MADHRWHLPQEDQLDRSDLVVCDRLAKDIEASCLEIPQGSREMVINLLTKLYAYWKAQEELKLNSDEAPAMPMQLPVDPGITHPA